jgi:hypothetical protein
MLPPTHRTPRVVATWDKIRSVIEPYWTKPTSGRMINGGQAWHGEHGCLRLGPRWFCAPTDLKPKAHGRCRASAVRASSIKGRDPEPCLHQLPTFALRFHLRPPFQGTFSAFFLFFLPCIFSLIRLFFIYAYFTSTPQLCASPSQPWALLLSHSPLCRSYGRAPTSSRTTILVLSS